MIQTQAVRRPGVGLYVDGYNLYYGRLRGSPFKWLDLVTLGERLLAERGEGERIERAMLFTAPALASFATHGQASAIAQADYHRALLTLHGDRLDVVYGAHHWNRRGVSLPEYVEGQPYDRHRRVKVWKIEEKKTDVNLALRLYRDAVDRKFDRIILVSNDSDAEPALEAIRQSVPDILIGVVMPTRAVEGTPDLARRPSMSLVQQADWVVRHLSDDQLRASQLPEVVPTRKKPIRKPAHW